VPVSSTAIRSSSPTKAGISSISFDTQADDSGIPAFLRKLSESASTIKDPATPSNPRWKISFRPLQMNNYAMLESFQTAKGRSGIQHKRSVIGPGFQVSLARLE
jgi:hypothetical protein